MLNPTALAELELMAQGPDELIVLPKALLIASLYAYDAVDVEGNLAELRDLAAGLTPQMTRANSLHDQLAALTYYLSQECGFQGNREDFYNPKNSHLQHVLAHRRGIPISLAVVYMEVARANGLLLHPVGFPFHFLLGVDRSNDCFLDPFVGGRLLDREDCLGLFESYGQPRTRFEPEFLAPITNRAVLVRSMTNLKCAHLRLNQIIDAISCIDLILLWDPLRYGEYRDRGLLWADQGCWPLAVRDFSAYLDHCPRAHDRQRIELALDQARTHHHQIH